MHHRSLLFRSFPDRQGALQLAIAFVHIYSGSYGVLHSKAEAVVDIVVVVDISDHIPGTWQLFRNMSLPGLFITCSRFTVVLVSHKLPCKDELCLLPTNIPSNDPLGW